ncbi:MAG: hypothetical protein L6R42_007154 [Xanthoria sp. 1 TBL-2021]|nr:MAG: hypothetical protein L6R42_007154 [Xanthoria sp. 1 TBL-2021]
MARLAYNNLNQNSTLSKPSQFHSAPRQDSADDESDTILDDRILERPANDMSPPILGHGQQRRDSFADNTSTISPRDNRWSDFSYHTDSTALLQSNNVASPLFFDHNGHAFTQDDPAPGPMYNHPSAAWEPQGGQGTCTPTTAYDMFSSDTDVKAMSSDYTPDSLNPQLQAMYGGLAVTQTPQYYSGNTLLTSPRSSQDWSSAESAEHMEIRSLPNGNQLSSPSYHTNPPLLRRDGIRKKNARFEIPAERTLRNIDTLISQTTNEQEIKELKQQKRLLRNRQAALDSRQRKKQHTERLEEEKKHTVNHISDLEEALEGFKIREEAWAQEREQLILFHQQQRQCIDELMTEKEELVRRHTIETGELRKKNAYLAEHAQKNDSIAMSAVPSSTGYSAEYSDFEHLTMESSPWDNFSLVTDFNMEAEQKMENSNLVITPKKERNAERESDTTTAPGLLLMLLLCGAWVVSNSSASTKSGPISRMPEEVRMASTAVLQTIYSDTGLQTQSSNPTGDFRSTAVRPDCSKRSRKNSRIACDATGRSHSPLGTLHRQLISPTEQQQRDHIFSMSADQYNGLTSDDAMGGSSHVTLSHRRNLGDALAALRLNKQGSAAEAYTRSLMWDEIPNNIVRDFARMVAESRQQEPMA